MPLIIQTLAVYVLAGMGFIIYLNHPLLFSGIRHTLDLQYCLFVSEVTDILNRLLQDEVINFYMGLLLVIIHHQHNEDQ